MSGWLGELYVATFLDKQNCFLIRATALVNKAPEYCLELYEKYGLSENRKVKQIVETRFERGLPAADTRKKREDLAKVIAPILLEVYEWLPIMSDQTLQELTTTGNLLTTEVLEDPSKSFAAVEKNEELPNAVKNAIENAIKAEASGSKAKVYTANKITPKSLCPKWRSNGDAQLDLVNTLHFLSGLERYAKKDYYATEALLIEQALTNSDKVHLLETMPPGTAETVESFKTFIIENYLPPKDDLSRMLWTINQKDGEPTIEFVNRCVVFYYFIKLGTAPITMDELSKPANTVAWNDIKGLLLNGLKNQALQMQLKLIRDELSAKNLIPRIRAIESALPLQSSVMRATLNNTTQQMESQDLVEKVVRAVKSSLEKKKGKKEKKEKTLKNPELLCTHCQKNGHIKENCWEGPGKGQAPEWYKRMVKAKMKKKQG